MGHTVARCTAPPAEEDHGEWSNGNGAMPSGDWANGGNTAASGDWANGGDTVASRDWKDDGGAAVETDGAWASAGEVGSEW